MPELPEVEITRRGIAPLLTNATLTGAIVRNRSLRWPVPLHLGRTLAGARVRGVTRRAKYIVVDCGGGSLIIHLGMSGSLRIVPVQDPPGPHDHVDIQVGSHAIRMRDPRRFGAVLWHTGAVATHPLLAHLGVEPLSDGFNGLVLHKGTRNRSVGIKIALMDHRLVVGVGNIYASESLFRARISPRLRARRLSLARCEQLAVEVRETLTAAIDAGGSSLRDFVHSDGKPGYFQQQYFVYDRAGQPCRICATPIRRIVQGQRATFYCPACQPK